MPLTMWRYGVEETAWFSFSYSPMRDGDGVVCGLVGICEETTASVLAAAEARAKEDRDRQVLDSASDHAVIAMDLAGRITRWNKGAQGIFGWPEQQMLGQTVHCIFTPEDMARGDVEAEMRDVLAHGGVRRERWQLRKSGERFWSSGEMTPLRDEAGKVLGFVKMLRDRTEEREAAEALRLSQAQLAAALADVRRMNDELENRVAARTAERDRLWETSPDLLLVLDFEGFFRRVNPAWSKLLGYAPDELIGQHVSKFVLPDDTDLTREAYQFAAGGGSPAIENRYRHKDGSIRWFSWVAGATNDTIYATGRHITGQKQGWQRRATDF
jgi:PAS domain S-box-containing protein